MRQFARRLVLRFGVFTLVFVPLSLFAQEGELPVFKALRDADERALHIELERARANPVLRELLTSLMKGDSESTFNAAEECVARATAERASGFAFFCNQIAGSQYRSRGDLQKWAQMMILAKRMPFAAGKTIGGGFDGLDYQILGLLPSPSWSFKGLGADGLVVKSTARQPVVEIEVAGAKLQAVIDTGSNVAVILKRSAADKLGLLPVVQGVYLLPESGGAENQTDQMLIADVKIKSVLAKSIGVVSTSKIDHLQFDAIIGLPFLEQIDRVTFVGDGPVASRGECKPQRMLRSTEQTGMQRLMLPVTLKGGSDYAFLDTGMNVPFTVHAPSSSGRPSAGRAVLTALGEMTAYSRDVEEELTVLGVHMGPAVGQHRYAPELAFPTMIGMGAFEGRSVTLDFSKGLACVR